MVRAILGLISQIFARTLARLESNRPTFCFKVSE
jgi:hypothetical protein